MSVAERFFDTNVLLYLLSADVARADTVEELQNTQVIDRRLQIRNPFAAHSR